MRAEETTAVLLDRVRGGDDAARQRLAARYLPMLQRWRTVACRRQQRPDR